MNLDGIEDGGENLDSISLPLNDGETNRDVNNVHECNDGNMDDICSMPDYTPRLGLEFDSEDNAFKFYNNYGGIAGFSIRREYANKCKKTQRITSRKFVCSKEGYRATDKRDGLTKNPRAETRTGCDAHMIISLNKKSEKYEVYSFEAKHNHELHIQECVHMMPSQRKISNAQALQAEVADASGIRLRSSYEFASRLTGGRQFLGFTRHDLKNYLWTKRQRDLEFGEAGALLTYFEEQSLQNPSFHYTMQLDIEEQITNIFWADAKMIADYGQFGDVVSFDTTYRTNKDGRPLAAFVGFNNYRKTVIFGAALLYDETAPSFKWLFESFLNAMSGKKPKTIFTDQDHAMAKAIPLVMPETSHRICIWHMMQNAIKHLGNIFKDEDGIKEELKAFIYYYEEEADFKTAWEAMLSKYDGLRENNWIQSIYKEREKWGKPYVMDFWSAWADTTQISESFNSKLRTYLPTDLGILHFFKHFERVVDHTRYTELECEYNSRQKLPRVGLPVPLLINAGEIYTDTIFEFFKEQYSKSLWASAWKCDESSSSLRYMVSVPDEYKVREVNCSPQGLEMSCTCRLFERCGILCAHALKTLDLLNIKTLPDHFILKRWAKKAKDGMVQDMDRCVNTQTNTNLEVTSRYRMLCPNLVKLGCRAAESPETFNLVAQITFEAAKRVEDILSGQSSVHQHAPSSSGDKIANKNELHNSDAIRPKGLKKKESSKGRPKTRPKSWVELQRQGKKKRLARALKKASNPPTTYPSTSCSLPQFQDLNVTPYIPTFEVQNLQPHYSSGTQIYEGIGNEMPNSAAWLNNEISQSMFSFMPFQQTLDSTSTQCKHAYNRLSKD